MTEDPPKRPADPRPFYEPYYRDNHCEECGEELVLYDNLSDEQRRSSEAFSNPETDTSDIIWYDEWACPRCLDGVRFDWPEEELESLWDRVENTDSEDFVPSDEVKENLGFGERSEEEVGDGED